MSSLFGLFLLLGTYYLRHYHVIDNEGARKLVHFAHAITVAAWAVTVGYWFVIIAEVVFLAVVLAAREYQIFHALRKVGRKSWGEFFLPTGVIILALINPHISVFLAALLIAGLADAAAAVVGKHPESLRYKIFGQNKSVAGSLTFFAVAMAICAVIFGAIWPGLSGLQLTGALLLVPLVATIIENVSTYGSDNITIPIGVYGTMLLLGIA